MVIELRLATKHSTPGRGHAHCADDMTNQLIPYVRTVLSRVPVEHRAQGAVIGISENSGQSNLIFEQNFPRNLIRLRTPENSL